jgi:hypothetical protein
LSMAIELGWRDQVNVSPDFVVHVDSPLFRSHSSRVATL